MAQTEDRSGAKKVKLSSSDGDTFEVDRDVISASSTIKDMLDNSQDAYDDEPIPLQNVSTNILKRIIQWAQYHRNDQRDNIEDEQKDKRSDDICPWDVDFLKVDQGTLFELLLAANYLGIDGLLDSTCKTVANQIKGKCADDIRKTFNIQNDFTPEEEAEVKRENQWCEEK